MLGFMKAETTTAEVHIHLRARTQDRDLIDQAAELAGTNRSQFMLQSALKEAQNLILDQTRIVLDSDAFDQVLDWMDSEPSDAEKAGMERLMSRKPKWVRP